MLDNQLRLIFRLISSVIFIILFGDSSVGSIALSLFPLILIIIRYTPNIFFLIFLRFFRTIKKSGNLI